MRGLKIIDAYPPTPQVLASKRPQCQAPLSLYLQERIASWNLSGRSWYRHQKPGQPEGTCANKARYQINGKWYCRKHAGLIVLDTLAKASGGS